MKKKKTIQQESFIKNIIHKHLTDKNHIIRKEDMEKIKVGLEGENTEVIKKDLQNKLEELTNNKSDNHINPYDILDAKP